MKRFIILCLSAAVALSLSACTPTPQKQAETAETMPPTTEAFKADTMEIRNSGNEDLPEMATVSIYRVNKKRDGSASGNGCLGDRGTGSPGHHRSDDFRL